MHSFRNFARGSSALATAVAALVAFGGLGAQASVGDSLVYVDGATRTMVTAHAMAASNSGLESAPPLWVLVFAPGAVPPGYTPQCDPCDHPNNPNLPAGGDFHDHVLPSAPGFGTADTAGQYRGPWLITILVYNPAFTGGNTSFQPITSDTQLADVETASALALAHGGVPELLPINRGGVNPFERSTGQVLICPIVQS